MPPARVTVWQRSLYEELRTRRMLRRLGKNQVEMAIIIRPGEQIVLKPELFYRDQRAGSAR